MLYIVSLCLIEAIWAGLNLYQMVHTQERLWRRDLYDGAKLRRANLESGASHNGLCHTLVQCDQLFGP